MIDSDQRPLLKSASTDFITSNHSSLLGCSQISILSKFSDLWVRAYISGIIGCRFDNLKDRCLWRRNRTSIWVVHIFILMWIINQIPLSKILMWDKYNWSLKNIMSRWNILSIKCKLILLPFHYSLPSSCTNVFIDTRFK